MHMILLLTGCWLLLGLPNQDTDPVDTSWWTDADLDTDTDSDTDADVEYFDAYVWVLDFHGGFDGQDLIPYGIGGDIEQPPYLEVSLYEERWFENQSDLHKCVATFEGHSEQVSRFVWINFGQQLLSVSLDGTLKIWNLMKQSCIFTT